VPVPANANKRDRDDSKPKAVSRKNKKKKEEVMEDELGSDDGEESVLYLRQKWRDVGKKQKMRLH
jgi:hypothetical protein